MQAAPPPVVTQELQVVDDQGRARLVLSAKSGEPSIVLMRPNGQPGAQVALDAAGRPSVKLANPDLAAPSAAIEIDDKGAHVKFDRPGGASSYLFLNNAGGSGVVLIGPDGKRKLDVLVDAKGALSIIKFGPDGKPLP